MKKLSISIILITLLLSNCTYIIFEGAGVFKDPVKYKHPKLPSNPDNKNEPVIATITMQDGKKISFWHLGSCGSQFGFFGIIVPIIPLPFFETNKCESDGFTVSTVITTPSRVKNSNLKYKLRYNGKIYDSIKNTHKFKIPNFSAFKKAKDKTLIITKKTDNGNIITKEIPFEWKVTSHVVSIP